MSVSIGFSEFRLWTLCDCLFRDPTNWLPLLLSLLLSSRNLDIDLNQQALVQLSPPPLPKPSQIQLWVILQPELGLTCHTNPPPLPMPSHLMLFYDQPPPFPLKRVLIPRSTGLYWERYPTGYGFGSERLPQNFFLKSHSLLSFTLTLAPNFNKKELGVEFHVTLDFASPSQSPFVPNPAAPSCLDHLIAELNYRPLTH